LSTLIIFYTCSNEHYEYLGRPSIPSVTQPLTKAERKEKNVQKGLDNSGNIEGISVAFLPMTTVVSVRAYLLSTLVEAMPNARAQPRLKAAARHERRL
jgi:hypothetical protein